MMHILESCSLHMAPLSYQEKKGERKRSWEHHPKFCDKRLPRLPIRWTLAHCWLLTHSMFSFSRIRVFSKSYHGSAVSFVHYFFCLSLRVLVLRSDSLSF